MTFNYTLHLHGHLAQQSLVQLSFFSLLLFFSPLFKTQNLLAWLESSKQVMGSRRGRWMCLKCASFILCCMSFRFKLEPRFVSVGFSVFIEGYRYFCMSSESNSWINPNVWCFSPQNFPFFVVSLTIQSSIKCPYNGQNEPMNKMIKQIKVKYERKCGTDSDLVNSHESKVSNGVLQSVNFINRVVGQQPSINGPPKLDLIENGGT